MCKNNKQVNKQINYAHCSNKQFVKGDIRCKSLTFSDIHSCVGLHFDHRVKQNTFPESATKSLFCSMNIAINTSLFTLKTEIKKRKIKGSLFFCDQQTHNTGRHAYKSRENNYFCLLTVTK